MSHPHDEARAACTALCMEYAAHADAARADDFAALFVPDAVFDRLGQEISGHDALRQSISGRAPGVWTQHACSNVCIEVAPDGQSATGTADLEMQRGQRGSDAVERLRGRYVDAFVRTDAGWKFKRRSVRLAPA